MPVGQLDGGHIAYALMGERHHKFSKLLILCLVLLGVVAFEGWLIWALLLVVLGLRHPPILEPYIPIDPRRRAIGVLALIIFVLTFIPVPLTIIE